MANEIGHNWVSGATLYACRFQLNGDVFITTGASDEEWGTGGNTAADYDVTMPEKGDSGHYVGDFDTSDNIGDGWYRVTVYLQAGANPADTDKAIAQGITKWKDGAVDYPASLADVGAEHDTTDALIASEHVTTDALITSEHVTTDALIVSEHVTTDALIASVRARLAGVVTIYDETNL